MLNFSLFRLFPKIRHEGFLVSSSTAKETPWLSISAPDAAQRSVQAQNSAEHAVLPLQQTSNQPSQAYSPQATPTSTGAQVASATSAATTAATKSSLTWVIVAVVAVVAVGAGWFFFFNNDITGTWVAEESGTTVEAVFDQGGTGTMTLYDAGKSTDNVDFTYEMNDGYLLIQTKTTLYKFGRTVRVPCEIHGNTMIWDPDGDNVTFTRQ